MKEIEKILNQHIDLSDKISVSVLDLIVLITAITIATIGLRIVYKLITRRLPETDKSKFKVIFGYFKWLIYLIIFLIVLHSVGISLTAVLAASAALLIGVGLALQTLFQDIIAGVLILTDQTLHVGDIIEIDGKVGKVEEIKLRTTRAVTIDNKVLIIPHHLYLTNSLYNWTQNGTTTRESVSVNVAYGSDIELVKKILLDAAINHSSVLKHPAPLVLFNNFGDSSLDFKLIFTLNESFQGVIPKSDIRFEIVRLFRKHNISIPFPQRDIHIVENNNK